MRPGSPHSSPHSRPAPQFVGNPDAPSDPHQEGVGLLSDDPPSTPSHPPSTLQRRLLSGFYVYSIATETFAIVSLTLFLPICLEQLAREHGGRSGSELNLPCLPTGTGNEGDEGLRCFVKIFGGWVDTASYSLMVYSLSVFLQAITVVSIGSLADDPVNRHRLLVGFATIGASCTTAFIFIPSFLWLIASSLLTLGANVSFGASMVCLNSYLPELGRNTKEVIIKREELDEARENLRGVRAAPAGGTGEDLLGASQSYARAQEGYLWERSKATSHISSRGVALGYGAGISALLLLLVPVTLMGGSTFSLQAAISGSGLFWAAGTLPAALWLRPAETPEVIRLSRGEVASSIKEGWIGLFVMLRASVHKLPSTAIFLVAWFLLSDSFSTITSVAMLFAKTSLSMSTTNLILISAITPFSGILGAILFPKLQKEFLGFSNIQMLCLLVALATLVPVWGLFFLRSQWQMFLLAIYFGAIYGSFQAFARTCFSELIPPFQSARWFGLYSITDKSSSFVGPLLVALITNATGEIRHGFYLILIMLVIAIPVLSQVDMVTGSADAERYQTEALAASVEDFDETLEED